MAKVFLVFCPIFLSNFSGAIIRGTDWAIVGNGCLLEQIVPDQK